MFESSYLNKMHFRSKEKTHTCIREKRFYRGHTRGEIQARQRGTGTTGGSPTGPATGADQAGKGAGGGPARGP